jgi:DNA polymerase-3 subunit delta
LQKELHALYVLSGDEPLALMECTDALRAAASSRGHHERSVLLAERNFNWEQLVASGQAMSLFSDKKLTELRIPSGKPGTEGGKALQAYAAHLPPDTVTVITLPKLDKDGQKSAWFSALEKVATVIMIQPVEIDRLPRWIGARLAQQGQQADEATLDFLANQVEGNLLAAHQEIQKLALLQPQGKLDPAAVREAVLNVSRYDAFQLGDAMLHGDPERASRVLTGLQSEGMQPLALLGMLSWLLRGVTRVKAAEVRGENLANAMQQARIWGERQALVKRALARWSLRHLNAAMQKMAEIDKMAKGVAQGEPWLELNRMCMGLTRLGLKRQQNRPAAQG